MGSQDYPLYLTDEAIAEIEKDRFGHAHIADAVYESITHTKPPFIIGILGGWGTGKSSILAMVKAQLDKEGVPTVLIDAWRYSSADNLRRDLLVRVVRAIAPGELDDLKDELYTTRQQAAPASKKKSLFSQRLTKSAIIATLQSLIFIFGRFLLASSMFFGVLVIVSLIQFKLRSDLQEVFDWQRLLDRFLDLAFVPFLLAIADILRPYLVHEPVVVTRERIDSDELFSESFDDAVKSATRSLRTSRRRLVIFVDNLDRLNSDKMVEALETLKTFLGNQRCIFVVACDDEVVRSAIQSSDMVPRRSIPKETNVQDGKNSQDFSSKQKLGEDYLDKFFQQTFRLPAYLIADLSDFAEHQFTSTRLANELLKSGIDIRDLRSTIIPSDVTSPRKVKRLLNEFIANYEIARRRELSGTGQLREGALTDNPGFLAKMSTIRAEYPEFYERLVDNPALLTEINEGSTNLNDKGILSKLEGIYDGAKQRSLQGYVLKTQTVKVDDIEPYIWFSQDNLARGLRPDVHMQLRIALSNGDIGTIEELLTSSKDQEESKLIAIVASRLVEQRLSGGDLVNGTIALTKLIKFVDEPTKKEISQVAANSIPNCPLDRFDTADLLSVLHWSERAENTKLINAIFQRLDNGDLRGETFETIVSDPDEIDAISVSRRLDIWLRSNLSPKDISDQAIVEFGDQIVANISNNSYAEIAMTRILGNVIPRYILGRLTMQLVESPVLSPDDPSFIVFQDALLKFGSISANLVSNDYWNSLNSLALSGLLHLYLIASDQIRTYLLNLPNELPDQTIISLSAGLAQIPQQAIENGEVSLTDELNLLTQIDETGQEKVSPEALKSISTLLLQLSANQGFVNNIERFIRNFVRSAEANSRHPVTAVAVTIFGENLTTDPIGPDYLTLIVDVDDNVSSEARLNITQKVLDLANSSDPAMVAKSSEYLSRLLPIENYRVPIRTLTSEWLGLIKDENAQVLGSRLSFLMILNENSILPSEDICSAISSLFPYSNDQDRLDKAIEVLHQLSDDLEDDTKSGQFETLVPHLALDQIFEKLLELISNWYHLASDEAQHQFSEILHSKTDTYPVSVAGKLPLVVKRTSDERLLKTIVRLYSQDFDEAVESVRGAAASDALHGIKGTARKDFSMTVLDGISSRHKEARNFWKVATPILSHEDVRDIRSNALNRIRTEDDVNSIEADLRLLASTIRADIRDVMAIVQAFEVLFAGSIDKVNLAARHIVACLQGMPVRSVHKHRLAKSMSDASKKFDEDIKDLIKVQAGQLGLYGFKFGAWAYAKYWNT